MKPMTLLPMILFMCLASGGALAQRTTCTASFNAATGILAVDAAMVGSTKYLAKIPLTGSVMAFNLDSAAITTNGLGI